MPLATFYKILFLIEPELSRAEEMGLRASRPIVPPDLRLAVGVMMLTGALECSVMRVFCIGRKTAYNVFHSTRKAIDATLTLPGFLKTLQGLQRSSEDFQILRKPANPLPGCVGAQDGICVKIMTQNNDHHPATFYCRKYFYSIPVQAILDYIHRS